MSASALGAAAAGAGSLIDSVSNLLPTTVTANGKTKTKASAESLTEGGQLDLSKSSTSNIGTSNSQTSSNDMRTNTSQGSEDTRSSTSSTTNTRSSEKFSGQNNQETSQTLVSDEGIMRIMTMALQGDQSGFGGLQQLVSGERSAGLFNSSTNQMLVNDLLTRVSGEAERLSAKTVNNQSLGATSTDTNTTSNTLVDAVTSAMSRLSERSAGSTSGVTSGRTQTQENTDSGLLSLAQQLGLQSSESESDNTSKTKSKKGCGIFVICASLTAGMFYDSNSRLESMRDFRDSTVANIDQDQIARYYQTSPKFVSYMESLSMDDSHRFQVVMRDKYIDRIIQLHKSGKEQEAYQVYLSFLQLMETVAV